MRPLALAVPLLFGSAATALKALSTPPITNTSPGIWASTTLALPVEAIPTTYGTRHEAKNLTILVITGDHEIEFEIPLRLHFIQSVCRQLLEEMTPPLFTPPAHSGDLWASQTRTLPVAEPTNYEMRIQGDEATIAFFLGDHEVELDIPMDLSDMQRMCQLLIVLKPSSTAEQKRTSAPDWSTKAPLSIFPTFILDPKTSSEMTSSGVDTTKVPPEKSTTEASEPSSSIRSSKTPLKTLRTFTLDPETSSESTPSSIWIISAPTAKTTAETTQESSPSPFDVEKTEIPEPSKTTVSGSRGISSRSTKIILSTKTEERESAEVSSDISSPTKDAATFSSIVGSTSANQSPQPSTMTTTFKSSSTARDIPTLIEPSDNQPKELSTFESIESTETVLSSQNSSSRMPSRTSAFTLRLTSSLAPEEPSLSESDVPSKTTFPVSSTHKDLTQKSSRTPYRTSSHTTTPEPSATADDLSMSEMDMARESFSSSSAKEGSPDPELESALPSPNSESSLPEEDALPPTTNPTSEEPLSRPNAPTMRAPSHWSVPGFSLKPSSMVHYSVSQGTPTPLSEMSPDTSSTSSSNPTSSEKSVRVSSSNNTSANATTLTQSPSSSSIDPSLVTTEKLKDTGIDNEPFLPEEPEPTRPEDPLVKCPASPPSDNLAYETSIVTTHEPVSLLRAMDVVSTLSTKVSCCRNYPSISNETHKTSTSTTDLRSTSPEYSNAARRRIPQTRELWPWYRRAEDAAGRTTRLTSLYQSDRNKRHETESLDLQDLLSDFEEVKTSDFDSSAPATEEEISTELKSFNYSDLLSIFDPLPSISTPTPLTTSSVSKAAPPKSTFYLTKEPPTPAITTKNWKSHHSLWDPTCEITGCWIRGTRTSSSIATPPSRTLPPSSTSSSSTSSSHSTSLTPTSPFVPALPIPSSSSGTNSSPTVLDLPHKIIWLGWAHVVAMGIVSLWQFFRFLRGNVEWGWGVGGLVLGIWGWFAGDG